MPSSSPTPPTSSGGIRTRRRSPDRGEVEAEGCAGCQDPHMPPSADARDRRTILVVILSTLLVLGAATAGTVVLVYRHLDGRLTTGTAIHHSITKTHRAKE